jgi:L-fuculose-phosphate aldolase
MPALEDLAETCRIAYAQKLVGGTGGNMSVRIGDDVYITATGCRLGDVCPETLVRVSLDGSGRENGTPSKELNLHLGIYRTRKDVAAVAHLHPVNSIIVSVLADGSRGLPMPSYTPGFAAKIPSCGLVPLLPPGSEELARAVTEACLAADVVLMKNHGIIAVGRDIKSAFSLVEEAEQNAIIHLYLKGTGAFA